MISSLIVLSKFMTASSIAECCDYLVVLVDHTNAESAMLRSHSFPPSVEGPFVIVVLTILPLPLVHSLPFSSNNHSQLPGEHHCEQQTRYVETLKLLATRPSCQGPLLS